MQASKPPLILSAKLTITLALAAIALTTVLVFILGHRSVLRESQIALSIISVLLFLFLSVGLYTGVELKADAPSFNEWKGVSFADPNVAGAIDHAPIDISVGDDIVGSVVGCLLMAVVWVLLSVLLTVLAWLLTNLVVGVVFILFVLIYWVFYQALRTVFRHSPRCKGQIAESIAFSLAYTFLYMGWMFVVIMAINRVAMS